MNYRTPYHLCLALLLGACSAIAQAQYSGIYTFNGNAEGCCANNPNMIAQGTDGYLYGTLPSGGAGNDGSWFQYPMSGFPTMVPFSGTGLSAVNSGFTLGIDGNFYGSSINVNGTSYGAIFKMSGGALTTLYTFNGTAGLFPDAPPVQGLDGNLYGIAMDYGNSGYAYQVILSSTGQATLGWHLQLPSASRAPLLLANDGNFYGTYSNGSFSKNASGVAVPSPNGNGGIFQITPAGVVSWYYNLNPFSTFPGGDGSNPKGPVMQAADGNLYGSANSGGAYGTAGGVVYKIALNGTGYTPIYSFQFSTGTAPMGGLVQGSDGYLYGLTTTGGTLSSPYSGHNFVSSGTLFKVSTSGTSFKLLFTFFRVSGVDGHGPGSEPEATPVLHTNGKIYGLTHSGGYVTNGATSATQGGFFDDDGEFYTYNPDLSPFVSVVGQRSAHVGDRVTIIGQGFLKATGVTFGGVPIPWVKLDPIIWNDNSMSVIVPSGAKTGLVTVQEPTGNLSTLYNFTITCSGPLCRRILYLP